MPSPVDVYRRIHAAAPGFAEQLLAASRASRNEAELRGRVAHHIQALADEWGVRLDTREEYTLAEGSADTVYNRVVVEYKAPGTFRPDLGHARTARAVEQMRGYIAGLAREQGRGADRFLGVALDGQHFVFARYFAGHWNVEAAVPVAAPSAERFLRALFSLAAGRALIPQNLVEDFGQSDLAHEATRALYLALERHPEGLPAKLFEQWRTFFAQVSGYDEQSVRLKDKVELRAFAQGMGLSPAQVDPPRLLFAIHTYFSFLVKSIARLVLQRYAAGKLAGSGFGALASLTGPALHHALEKVEGGDIFHALGLLNLLEGDFFSWYLQAWDSDVEEALRSVLVRLADYNPATLEDDPYAARDLLKKLYHYLLPRELRHDLGEYYTPDWLAERVLTQVNEPRYIFPKGVRSDVRGLARPVRLLDPACGSGTFLVLAIRALKEHCRRQEMNERDALELILKSVVGIDLNPLAVMAARVNYLLAVADLVEYAGGPVEVPVYLADSILPPQPPEEKERMFKPERRVLKTSVGDLPVPLCVDTREEMDRLANLLEEYVRGRFAPDAFVDRACADLGIAPDSAGASVLRELFMTLSGLEQQGLDGIWARVLKNAFMPLFLEPFGIVVGNPPWVNWESLPEGYRRESAYLWQQYGLFSHRGFAAILGKSKDDISILMTYAVVDRFLKDKGKLGFVITQSVFKTAGAGQGFRRFRIGVEGAPLGVLAVDDMSELQPFEGATNRTAIVVLQKGRATRYPVAYTLWRKVATRRFDFDSTLDEVQASTERLNLAAVPVSAEDPTSSWLSARKGALDAIRKAVGPSDYQARAGVCTWLNPIYWLRIVATRQDGLCVVQNITEGAKREVTQVTAELEAALLHPLLRGRDVSRWGARSSGVILLTHVKGQRLNAISDTEMQRNYPKTYGYLRQFEAELRARSGYRRYFTPGDPFYSVFNVGDYTFAPYKVVWREQAAQFTAAVVEGQDLKPAIPDHKLMLVALPGAEEAHYVCAALNSTPAVFAVSSYAISIQMTTHVTEHIRVPRFDPGNVVHRRLAELSERAHGVVGELSTDAETDKRMKPRGSRKEQAVAAEDPRRVELRRELAQIEAQVDHAAAELWGLTPQELAEVQRSLKELRA